jgi:hypothetical protein
MADDKKVPQGSHLGSLLERYDWKKVVTPKMWHPKKADEELVGFFGGKSVRNGRYGQYEVVIIHIPRRGSLMISGVRIVNLVDASGIDTGWPIRIVWLGEKEIAPGEDGKPRRMKDFDVYIAEGDPISADNLPAIRGSVPPAPENDA